MKAYEARAIFFEDYVEFEHNVRKLIKVYRPDFSTANKSLDKILDNLAGEIMNDTRIRMSLLRKHKQTRNWLAHQPKSSPVPEKYIENMNNIKEMNLYIIYLIKNPFVQ